MNRNFSQDLMSTDTCQNTVALHHGSIEHVDQNIDTEKISKAGG